MVCIQVRGICGDGSPPFIWDSQESFSGVQQITLVPVAPQLSVATLNPYACGIQGYSCTAMPSTAAGPDEVTSAPAASMMSADGQSATVVVINTNDQYDPVQISLAGPPGFSDAIGSLSSYDRTS